MKTVYLLYISAGVALATIFYLYKSHKETMKKIETIQNLVSSIQQVPVMKYNDTEIQTTIKTRCDDIEELIHFVNDEINTKLDNTINTLQESTKPNLSKQNNSKSNIPKRFFSEFIAPKEINKNTNEDYLNNQKICNDMSNNSNHNSYSNSQSSQNIKNINLDNHHENIANLVLEDQEYYNNELKNYHNEPILDIENYKDNEFTGLSLSSFDKATLDEDSVHNSSIRNDKGEVNLDNNEDLIETYDLNNKINMDINIDLHSEVSNSSFKGVSNIKQQDLSNNQNNTSNNHSVSDNSKIPKLNELKQIAKSRDLSTNGNKKEIIQRLLENGYNF